MTITEKQIIQAIDEVEALSEAMRQGYIIVKASSEDALDPTLKMAEVFDLDGTWICSIYDTIENLSKELTWWAMHLKEKKEKKKICI